MRKYGHVNYHGADGYGVESILLPAVDLLLEKEFKGRRTFVDGQWRIGVLQRFACARLPRPCLPGSLSRRFRNAHHHGF
jgi:hypothetical protein